MKKRLLAAALVFGFAFALIIVTGIQTARGQHNLTVEGVWEIVSVNSNTDNWRIGSRVAISRQGDGYAVGSLPSEGDPAIYKGNETHIARTELVLLIDPKDTMEGHNQPPAVKNKFSGQKVPINFVYTLSADGNFLTREHDGKVTKWELNKKTGEVFNPRYEIFPRYFKWTLRRISGPLKAENHSDRAYQANCGQVDPNRTAPFPADHEFCPGNLVCMTNFCGGGMGCPYVCCPSGLPYLNHCDCKCYATSEFDCHSYSYCREKLIR